MTVKTLTVSGLNVAAQVLGGTGLTSSTTNGVTTLSVSGTQSQATTFSGGLTISASATDVYTTITNAASGGRSWIINATSTSSGEGGGRLLFKDATANPVATRMTIDSAGNVGIGTTTPGALLEVRGSATTNVGSNAAQLWLSRPNATTGFQGLSFRVGLAYDQGIYQKANSDTLFIGRWGGSGAWVDSVAFDSSGNVGIGTSSPATTLEIAGTGFAGLQMKRRTDYPEISTGLYFDSVAASGTITLSGTTLTVVTTTAGAWAVGQVISGASITSTVTITALIATTGGTGGNGTYTVTNSTSQTISGTAVAATGINPGGNNYTIRASAGGLDFLNSSAVNVGGGGSKVYFSSAGNVGIGTTTPARTIEATSTSGYPIMRITVQDSTAATAFELKNNNTTMHTMTMQLAGTTMGAYGIIGASDAYLMDSGPLGNLCIGTDITRAANAGHIKFFAGGANSERMRIDGNGNVGIGTNSPTSTLHSAGSFAANITNITTATTLSSTHCVVYCSGTTSYAVTLPTAVGITGRMYYIKKTSTSSYTLTISTTSSQTIDGGNSVAFTAQYASYTVISDGSNWLII